MKDVRPAIRAILLADPLVNAAVTSGGTQPRIYPVILPQGITAPSLVQNLISETTGYHMQGDDGLMTSRTQIDAWATNPDDAVHLAGLVFDCLSGYTGIVAFGSNSPQSNMTVRGIFQDQGRDEYDSDSKMHVRHRDFMVWYVER
jgi:hypothetical protein